MNKNKIKILGLVVAVALVTAGAAFQAVAYSVARQTPYVTSVAAWAATTGGQAGGSVRIFRARDTLKFGDVVFRGGIDTVAKSTTLADYNVLAGVVVGGFRFSPSMSTSVAATDSGRIAARPGEQVWVLQYGRAWVTNDANGALTTGLQVIPSNATAGAVETRTTAIDTNYRVLGKAVGAIAASKFTLVDVVVK